MLRLFVLLLLVANGLFFAWSNGYLSLWGFASVSKNESFRLNEQIEPERIVLQQPNHATSTAPKTAALGVDIKPPTMTLQADSSLALTATNCLMSGVLNDKQSNLLKQTLHNNMPDLNWRFDANALPARWIVYMGKYGNAEQLEVKKKQLKQINVPYEVLSQARLEPGISLGSHPTQAAANKALQNLTKQGVRTARVVQETPDQQGKILVAPAVDELNRSKLEVIYADVLPSTAVQTLQVCQ